MALTLEEAQTRLSNIDIGDTEALKNFSLVPKLQLGNAYRY